MRDREQRALTLTIFLEIFFKFRIFACHHVWGGSHGIWGLLAHAHIRPRANSHCGKSGELSLNENEDLDKNTGMAIVNKLKPEISIALKIKYCNWDSIGTAFIQIVKWSAKIEECRKSVRALQP